MANLKLAPNEKITIQVEYDRIYIAYSRSLGRNKGSIVKRTQAPNFKTVVDIMRDVQQRSTGTDVGNFFNGSISNLGDTQEHDKETS